MVQDKMTSNKQIASGSKTLQELEEDFMWDKTTMRQIQLQRKSSLRSASVKDRIGIAGFQEDPLTWWFQAGPWPVVLRTLMTSVNLFDVFETTVVCDLAAADVLVG
jgi:hypothetical protein